MCETSPTFNGKADILRKEENSQGRALAHTHLRDKNRFWFYESHVQVPFSRLLPDTWTLFLIQNMQKTSCYSDKFILTFLLDTRAIVRAPERRIK